jgi:hypothetical protein
MRPLAASGRWEHGRGLGQRRLLYYRRSTYGRTLSQKYGDPVWGQPAGGPGVIQKKLTSDIPKKRKKMATDRLRIAEHPIRAGVEWFPRGVS